MLSIRENVFETNSSSCHSMTLNVSNEKLKAFNEGKLFYCDIPDARDRDFYTAEEVYGALIILGTINFSKVQFNSYGAYHFTEGEIESLWNEIDEADVIDRQNYLRWFFSNLEPDMIEWAFSNDTTPKYFSKKLIRITIQALFEENFYSPIVKVNDIFECRDKQWGVESIYELDSSDVHLDSQTRQLAAWKEQETYKINIEFRD